MSTAEDFENAPIGATAIHKTAGIRAMRVDAVAPSWIAQNVVYLDDGEMVYEGYTLESPASTTTRGALDLAWDLAHEVKEGQVIPKGAQYLELYGSCVREYAAPFDIAVNPAGVPIRTVEPLPDPLPDPVPDWLDAPAVLAHTDNDHDRRVWTALCSNQWVSTGPTYTSHWNELRDVVPLYPKGQDA